MHCQSNRHEELHTDEPEKAVDTRPARQLFVNTPSVSVETITLDVASASVDNLKTQIQAAVGAPPAARFCCSPSFFVRRRESMQIFIKALIGNALALDVKASERIDTVKPSVFLAEGNPPSQHRLFFEDTELMDYVWFDAYPIQKESTLQVQWNVEDRDSIDNVNPKIPAMGGA